ncbi:MAG: hypothetical protein GX907_00885 [Clostridiaceae bacterium]|nr:hypothetical protein [Clostridiaceae bacterium]
MQSRPLSEFCLLSRSKINLFLQIGPVIPEIGLHRLTTVMQELEYADDIRFRYSPPCATRATLQSYIPPPDSSAKSVQYELGNWLMRITVRGDVESPLNESNLCLRAMNVYYADFIKQLPLSEDSVRPYRFFALDLHKRIPTGAGLGGGSSNAATVLLVLNELFEAINFETNLPNLAQTLGSDVPYFLYGETALCSGVRGEVYPLPPLPKLGVLLLIPPRQVSAGAAFAAWDGLTVGESTVTEIEMIDTEEHIRSFSWTQPDRILWSALKNDFEALDEYHNTVAALRSRLADLGALHTQLSGSGPTVFALFPDRAAAEAANISFDATDRDGSSVYEDWQRIVTETYNSRSYIDGKGA